MPVTMRNSRFFSSVMTEPREFMEYDVVIVGAGPAGLSTAIRLKQQADAKGKEVSVCVVEKGAEVGSHIVSGNVFEPRALNELIPDWKAKGAPLETEVKKDAMFFLTEKGQYPLPVVPSLHNDGNYIISLNHFVRWLGGQAEELGVEIYPGFSASEVVYNDKEEVIGIATADMGIDKEGNPKDTFQRGMELRGRHTFFAEGCRGSLSQSVMEKYNLTEKCDPQTYGIGLKEVWEIPAEQHKPGYVQHTLGWPVKDWKTWQGTFMYHMKPNLVLIGMVVGLDYPNPYTNPYMEFQQFKHHPLISEQLKGGKCISYGARALNEGGLQSIPKLVMPGASLIGCSAGFLNVPKIKGTHTAMKSGMLAAEALFEQMETEAEGEDKVSGKSLDGYVEKIENSWVYKELKEVRNIHPSFKAGFLPFLAYSGLDTLLLKGRVPFTFKNDKQDWQKTKKAKDCKEIVYPKPDGVLSFDILSNLQRSGTNHDHDQPAHLKVKAHLQNAPANISYAEYAAPETRFCPAKVYEYTTDTDGKNPKLVINAQNCVHCKTCDIKTPENYIRWTVPQGGEGPAYDNM